MGTDPPADGGGASMALRYSRPTPNWRDELRVTECADSDRFLS
jgi:hypothetical protein